MTFSIRPVAGAVALVLAASLASPAVAWAGPRHNTPKESVSVADRLDPVSKADRKPAKVSGNRVSIGDLAVAVQASAVASTVDGAAVLDETNVDFVVRGLTDGAQILAVADNKDALTQRYSFSGRYLELRKDGSVIVRASDALSEPLAYIDPAWAKDANGAALSSSFTVDGSTLVQKTTSTSKTVFPVVADPRVRTAWYGWSIDFTRYETSRISKSTSACTAVAGLVATTGGAPGIVAAAVAAACGALTVFADTAVEAGKCVSVKVMLAGYLVVPWMPSCYA